MRSGTGDRDEANAVFTFSLLFGILVAAAFVIFSAISPGTLLQICGVSHKGRPRRGGSVCADYRISANGDRIGISLRDYCEEFDPMKFNEIHREDNRMSNIGIRMVMSLAKDIRYINTFNSNCLIMYLKET